jgi:oxygen-independent coproporphyrinogen III oxidase
VSGIYIHIPFCRQACHYCDFHFSTKTTTLKPVINAIVKEMELQRHFLDLKNDPVTTLYFGGGTPSMAGADNISRLIDEVQQRFGLASPAEITLEANPDDFHQSQKINAFMQAGINRLSLGIQSFHDAQLRYLNRAHDAGQAVRAVRNAQDLGLENISVDLIYALPGSTSTSWQQDLDKAIELNVPHISSYCLTIEDKTVFGNRVKKGLMKPVNEDRAAEQFTQLVDVLTDNNYEHYEISNFCLPGQYSKHNTNYWKQVPYLGLGPSAHSFNRVGRQYNVANNVLYYKAINENKIPATTETLSREDQINEYLMTGLRTRWGCELNIFKDQFNYDLVARQGEKLKEMESLVSIENNTLLLTQKGKLFADQVAWELFIV